MNNVINLKAARIVKAAEMALGKKLSKPTKKELIKAHNARILAKYELV